MEGMYLRFGGWRYTPKYMEGTPHHAPESYMYIINPKASEFIDKFQRWQLSVM